MGSAEFVFQHLTISTFTLLFVDSDSSLMFEKNEYVMIHEYGSQGSSPVEQNSANNTVSIMEVYKYVMLNICTSYQFPDIFVSSKYSLTAS